MSVVLLLLSGNGDGVWDCVGVDRFSYGSLGRCLPSVHGYKPFLFWQCTEFHEKNSL